MNHEPNPSTEHRAPSTIHAPNRNYVWTYTFVDELARAGLRDVVIAPGSRSTPLTMAFARHPAIRVWSHIDERGAAFMALGLGLAHDAPAAVVCSSGTAAANFYPAIVEAHYAHVPLLVLTADLPHELRDSGANQTVDQVKLYGDHVLWSVDVALPEANPPDVALRNLRTLADRAYALANGLPKGAVHINFPFRKPLEPTEVEGEGREIAWGWDTSPQTPMNGAVGAHHDAPAPIADHPAPHTQIERGISKLTHQQGNHLSQILSNANRALIVCGPRTPRGVLQEVVLGLADKWGAVLLADSLSNVRDGWMAFSTYEGYIHVARSWESPDVILHFGAMPVSQALDDYLNNLQPKHRIAISMDSTWTDFSHRIDWLLSVDPVVVCNRLRKYLKWYPCDTSWRDRFEQAEKLVKQIYEEKFTQYSKNHWSDAAAIYELNDTLPSNANVFVANSLPIRHFDQFYLADATSDISVFCNRGASGIDGVVSSAFGTAATCRDPVVAVIGDVAFFHDLNGLLWRREPDAPVVFVLVDND
ncbi:MAG: 2-succinyl-5-enolpyruvyl-6-hydroxy-3-cyclohexene-1-carboxylic-acid synthase, partial [Anaerolineae bacterium]|nr:2-succinyl-5-enolpyruvyl-6-hydroxy-3-cyclohexene-1-carboxylic-acid synthase [Anaerolineae bacterium]